MAVTVLASARPAVVARKAVAAKAVTVSVPKAAAVSGLAALAMTVAPAAQAASETMMLAEGEPSIVLIGWGALAASFSMSLAMTVWGRSGL